MARQLGQNVDPHAIATARRTVMEAVGHRLGDNGLKLVEALGAGEPADISLQAAARRSLKNALLVPLAAAGLASQTVEKHFDTATTMTDKLAALTIMTQAIGDAAQSARVLASFRAEYADFPLVIDKWFGVQAMMPGDDALERVVGLVASPDFTFDNPNRARSLLGAFAMANPTGFHRADGAAYRWFTEQIAAMDAINPQVAARLLTLMDSWTMMEDGRKAHARLALTALAERENLSPDVSEIVERALA